MQNYVACFYPGKNGKFDVTFPDFPGCISQGDNFADAQRMATEALALHVDGMREDGEAIPEPLGAALATHPGMFKGIEPDTLLVSIPLLPSPGKIVRIQVTMDSRLLSQIDAVTSNRSAFLADAASARLDSR